MHGTVAVIVPNHHSRTVIRITVVTVSYAVSVIAVVNHGAIPRIVERMPIIRCGSHGDDGGGGTDGKQSVVVSFADNCLWVMKTFDSHLVRVVNIVFDFVNAGVFVAVVVVVLVIVALCAACNCESRQKHY